MGPSRTWTSMSTFRRLWAFHRQCNFPDLFEALLHLLCFDGLVVLGLPAISWNMFFASEASCANAAQEFQDLQLAG